MARPSKLQIDKDRIPDEEIAPADEVFLSTKEIKQRYSNPSDMTLARWIKDPKTRFPPPVKFGRHNRWPLSRQLRYERERLAQANEKPPGVDAPDG
ncbi:hypothetical protein [Mesorhizobium sp. M0185]|uniref:helix-turn-helix transcriptional regulator n=1 Tax=Mesorhizobium sp. M0185 TaxID=2956907 RepID=UPI003338D887